MITMEEKTIAWCTGHYKTDFAKEKAKELRKQGYKAKLGYYIKDENGESYCKIYLVTNFEYQILSRLKNMQAIIVHGGESVEGATEKHRDNIKDICLKYKRSAKIEIDNEKIYAIVDDKGKKKELFVNLKEGLI